MSLIIAIVLILIIVFSRAEGKSADISIDKKKKDYEAWESKYTSMSLELTILDCIRDESNYDAICREISEAASKMKHWKTEGLLLNRSQIPSGLSKTKFKDYDSLVYNNQKKALGIMMANRKKIALDYTSSRGGYYAYLRPYYDASRDVKEARYEYIETIQNILKNNGVDVELVYDRKDDVYVFDSPWLERKKEDGYIEKFDRLLIDKKNPIPPI